MPEAVYNQRRDKLQTWALATSLFTNTLSARGISLFYDRQLSDHIMPTISQQTQKKTAEECKTKRPLLKKQWKPTRIHAIGRTKQ